MQRSTKIVATLGPASSAADVLTRMLAAGVDVVRLNFSHGTAADHEERARWCASRRDRWAARSRSWPTCRGRRSASASSQAARSCLKPGQHSSLDAARELGDEEGVGLDYKELPHDVAPGVILLLNDGLIRLRVESVRGTAIVTRVEVGGALSNNKGINRMGGGLTAPALTPRTWTTSRPRSRSTRTTWPCRFRRTRKTCTWRASSCAPPAAGRS